ncbi:uncharacterized protein ATNIH1004_003938 [Aspergillus tanneri]|uniref:Uncharacterized protein n=1 Tax=Aspergillus tanneri TaxID=1220188 RepID=A0A5M9MM15_9EURO|nr:uncharacterized protein ATNIH1004_003938 [Aspergillus tanneri]KAA8648055.1 hypothetical protein ATNIH1004_003938 [Aspergillus tanneri]
MRWTRKLHDFYVEQFNECNIQAKQGKAEPTWPIVLDTVDIMAEPVVLVKLYNTIGPDSYTLPTSGHLRLNLHLSGPKNLERHSTAPLQLLPQRRKEWGEEFGETMARS